MLSLAIPQKYPAAHYLTLLFILLTLHPALIAQNQTPSANDYFSPVKYRSIGPFRGGRSVCATGVTNDPITYYMGTTGGGLWILVGRC